MKYVGNISIQKEDIQYVMNAVTNDNSYGGTGDMSVSRRVTSCSIYQDINLSPVPTKGCFRNIVAKSHNLIQR